MSSSFLTWIGQRMKPDQNKLMEKETPVTAFARFDSASGMIVVDDCPHCRQEHWHESGAGNTKIAGCNGGEYLLIFNVHK